jgi:hypothetical protein
MVVTGTGIVRRLVFVAAFVMTGRSHNPPRSATASPQSLTPPYARGARRRGSGLPVRGCAWPVRGCARPLRKRRLSGKSSVCPAIRRVHVEAFRLHEALANRDP